MPPCVCSITCIYIGMCSEQQFDRMHTATFYHHISNRPHPFVPYCVLRGLVRRTLVLYNYLLRFFSIECRMELFKRGMNSCLKVRRVACYTIYMICCAYWSAHRLGGFAACHRLALGYGNTTKIKTTHL